MKRGAEKQISKGDDPDDEIQEMSGEETFKKADDAILATRKIRGLPKRSLAGTPPPTSNGTTTPDAPSTPTSKFGAFAGFGSPASNGSPFSFTPPAASPGLAASPSQPPQSFSQFGTSSSSSSSAFSSSTPAVAPTASNAAKAFASFVGDSTSKPPNSTPAPPPPLSRNTNTNTSSTYDVNTDDEAELNYYTSLRGLNISLLSAISKAVEGDPFVDVADVLEHYKRLRLNVQKEFDDKTANGNPSSSSSSTSSAPPLKLTSMPAPPSSFAGFGPLSSSKTSGGNGAFVPKPDNTTTPSSPMSGVSFSTPMPAAAPSSTSTSTKPFLFGSKPSSTDASTTSPFGTSVFGTSTSSTFGSAINAPTPSAFGAPKTDPPSTSTFGTFTSTSASLFGNSVISADNPPPPTNPFDSSNTADKHQPTAPANIFSTSAPSNAPQKSSTFGGFGGFGKPGGGSGSIGNPVGFGFGSPPKTPDVDGTGIGGKNSSGKPDSHGEAAGDKKSASVSEGEDAEGGAEAGDSGSGQAEGNSNLGLLTNNPHDEEGEGEEDEDTVHAVKLKAFKLRKEEEKGGGGWTELGYGVLRLKRHKESGARRMLLRNSGTGKININFKIYAGLKPSRSKKSVTFIGHDDDISQPYTLRFQSEEQAVELTDALDREIAFVKAKTED